MIGDEDVDVIEGVYTVTITNRDEFDRILSRLDIERALHGAIREEYGVGFVLPDIDYTIEVEGS